EYCTEFARRMLEDVGEFYPFGAEINASRELAALGFSDGEERPLPQELYSYAQNVLTQRAASGEVLGAAIAANVDIPPQLDPTYPDGIRVHVESEGFCRLIYLPYAIGRSGLFGRNRTIKYDDMLGVDVPPIIFAKTV
ncbi:MAG TPA: hypothetical protein VEW04_07850, partial [Allosphingosinicella sp.]|nr:hypothetical protein [Allosphingosinicella sp.]